MKHPFIEISKEVQRTIQILSSQVFTIKDTALSYRALNHYRSKSIISSQQEYIAGWMRLSAFDLVWISIVMKLRAFGMSLNVILRVKEFLFSKARLGAIDKSQSISFSFQHEIALAIHNKYELYLIVFEDYSCSFHDNQSIKNWRYKPYKSEMHINIPLSEIIQEVSGKLKRVNSNS